MKENSFTKFDAPGSVKPATQLDDLHDIIILPKNPVAPLPADASTEGEPATADVSLETNYAEPAAPHRAPRVQRFEIDRSSGRYLKAPTDLGSEQIGGRKVRSLASPADGYGPGLVLAPTRPEPAAQNGTCIIINQEHLRIRNVWTAARLDSEPARKAASEVATAAGVAAEALEPDEYKEPLGALDLAEGFELLVAAGQGRVFHVTNGAEPRELRDLGAESEIWYQLRNGFVAGSIYCRELGRVLPLVNVMTLVKGKEF